MTATVSADQFADRLFNASLGALDVLATYVGDRLGWYQALASGGPATAAELVDRAGGNARYAQEWLEQQAAGGILSVTSDGRFDLPPGPAEVLTDSDSLLYLAPLARMLSAAAVKLPALMTVYREGGGVSWEAYGRDMRESQADMNRPWFLRELAGALAKVDEVDTVLRRPDALIADIGCGAGWSSLALAKAYPRARIEGWDIDAPSVEMARANAAAVGLEDRVVFSAVDASRLGGASYDAIFAFECVHDMPRPVEVLAEMRRAVKPDGVVVIMDEAVSDAFEGPANEIDKLMYGFSLFVCLPDGLSSQPSVGTGTVMRMDTLRSYARQAGFRDVEVLPTGEFGFWRFYRLLP